MAEFVCVSEMYSRLGKAQLCNSYELLPKGKIKTDITFTE